MKEKRENKMYKKGELTTAQLVGLIVLIASFVILLYFLFILDLSGTSNAEICRNSVLLKDKIPGGVSGPLDCRTNYVCVSGSEDCASEDFSKISINPVNKDEIMKSIADEMVSCWWQFGGDNKIMYAGAVKGAKKFCAVCSIIEFDREIQEKYPEISYSEFYSYLGRTSEEGSLSYLKYLYAIDNPTELKIQEEVSDAITQDKILTNQKYSLITGIDANIVDLGLSEEANFINILGDDEWIRVYLIPTSETSKTQCQEFITKA